MAGMIKKIRVKASASDEGRVIPVGQIPQEEASCIYFKDENVPGDREGNLEIKSPAGKKLNLLADGESIQIKTGFKEDGKVNTLQLDVEAGGESCNEFPIKVCNGLKEKAIRVIGTKLNTAEVVLDTQNADTTEFDKTAMDVKFRNDTWNDGIETDGSGPIYAKLKARAIDLRCYDHGGIALQPAGADGEGFTNKIKFEHSLIVSPDHFGEYNVTVGTTQIGTETLYNFADDEWFLLGEITGYEVGVLEQAVQVFGEKVLNKNRSKWNDGMKMLTEGHYGITFGGDSWEIGVGEDPENISASGANGDTISSEEIIGKNLYIKRLASEGLKESSKPGIKLNRAGDEASGDYLKFIVPVEGEGTIQVASAQESSSTTESPIYAIAVEKDGKHWESDENGYIVIDNIQYKISSDKVSFDGEENRIFPISEGKFTIEPLRSIHFATAGGDGIEWGTFNPFHTSIFSSDYRFNAAGRVYAATRSDIEAIDGKCDFPTQADDFKDVLDESKKATWSEIVEVARKYADGEISGGSADVDLSGYATESFVTNAIAQAQLGGSEVDLSGYTTKEELAEALENSISGAIVNDLETEDSTKALSAAQGKALKGMISDTASSISGVSGNVEFLDSRVFRKEKNGNLEISAEGLGKYVVESDPSTEDIASPASLDLISDGKVAIKATEIEMDAPKMVWAAEVSKKNKVSLGGKDYFPVAGEDVEGYEDLNKAATYEQMKALFPSLGINIEKNNSVTPEIAALGTGFIGVNVLDLVKLSDRVENLENAEAPEQDLSEYVKNSDLESKGFATETFVTNAIAQAQLEGEDVDLSGYATKEELSSLSETCAKIDDLYDYAKVSDVQNTYVSKDELESEGFIKEIPSEYVTDSELTAKGYITSIPAGYVTVDSLESKGYITEADLNAKGYLTSFEVPAEYITESELAAKGYLTDFEIPAEYITESDLSAKEYITVNDIPDSYVTKEYLEDNNYLNSIPVSLSNQINSLISDVADIKTANTNQDTAISTLQAASLTGMRYIGSTSSVPTSASEGNVWKSTGSFTIDDKSVEPGDFIICTDSTPHFDVWQANVTKDAYFDTNTITGGQVLITDGTTGKVKCSGYTISKSVPSDAVFTDTTYSLATTSSNGLLSSADKAKIDQISELSSKITALETAKTELESTISELETKVEQLEGYVNALLERVDLENMSF